MRITATQSAATLAEAFTVSVSDEAASGARPDVIDATVGQLRAVAAYKANLETLQTADELASVLVELAAKR